MTNRKSGTIKLNLGCRTVQQLSKSVRHVLFEIYAVLLHHIECVQNLRSYPHRAPRRPSRLIACDVSRARLRTRTPTRPRFRRLTTTFEERDVGLASQQVEQVALNLLLGRRGCDQSQSKAGRCAAFGSISSFDHRQALFARQPLGL